MASNESWPGAIPKAIQAIEDNERARTPLHTQSHLDEAVKDAVTWLWRNHEYIQRPERKVWAWCRPGRHAVRTYPALDTLVAAEMAREKAPVTGERQP